jgi:hypothetical protein
MLQFLSIGLKIDKKPKLISRINLEIWYKKHEQNISIYMENKAGESF